MSAAIGEPDIQIEPDQDLQAAEAMFTRGAHTVGRIMAEEEGLTPDARPVSQHAPSELTTPTEVEGSDELHG